MADDAIGALALLDEPMRARMYAYIRTAEAPVTREQVAAELGISVKLAAFHLDKLAAAGLLATHFERPHGRTGPGAGRPAKHYRRSGAEFEVSIPQRDYELVASVLADAVKQTPASDQASRNVISLARRRGRQAARSSGAPARPGRIGIRTVERLLRDRGYEPQRDTGSRIELANCPFRAVAQESPEVVCSMNRAFIEGLVKESGAKGVQVKLDPAPGRCCVVLVPAEG
jgi:predicted ArsR family transcriptional regulator